MTYSNYKSHNTIKFLVGISPTGSITFLYRTWGRKTSNKITKSSGLIELLDEGVTVMADRGFSFPEYIAAEGVQLLIPASTHGKMKKKKRRAVYGTQLAHDLSTPSMH